MAYSTIISLATNESLNPTITETRLRFELDRLVTALQHDHPDAVFLLSTPPDHRDRLGRQHSRALMARNVIVEYAIQEGLAYYDLFELMGGSGSIALWQQAGLAQSDLIHLNSRGYRYIGQLFSRALLNAWEEYVR
jgi:lysophospholipase L1-like esterase